MRSADERPVPDSLVRAVRERAVPLRRPDDLDALTGEIARARIVMLGEASHGTHEFYEWRRMISERLIERHGFRFVAVEGDWPPCREVDRAISGREAPLAAREALKVFRRWPTWMWANREVGRLVDALRAHNLGVPEAKRVGFHGLDVYSLFESVDAVLRELRRVDPGLAAKAKLRYACFDPFRRDERAYVRSLAKFPEGCAEEVEGVLRDLLWRRMTASEEAEPAFFDAEQNARVIANAEDYYRAMIRADDDSWNVRDRHMLETLETLLDRYGPTSKAIVWAHNTHVGDYRATDMVRHGHVNLGGIAREKFGEDAVALVGFGTYVGEVVASHAWDGPIETLRVPAGRPGSYESVFHSVAERIGHADFFVSLRGAGAKSGPLAETRGHRAIGVVYDPDHERYGNYVPTSLANRYDAFVFFDRTKAVSPYVQGFARREIPETWPGGV